MATKRKSKKNEALIAFEAIALEGGLLSPELLSRVARLEAGAQGEADYRVPGGLQIRDEIGRNWRTAQALWAELAAGRAAGADRQALAERFVGSLLRDCLGFGSLREVMSQTVGEYVFPLRFAALDGRVPVVIAPLPGPRKATELETSVAEFGEAGRKRSAFGLAQEYLNAVSESVWGIVCDGLRLRMVRDNSSLTRPAYVEVDLARIFDEELYSDFAAFWLLAHETRFGRADVPSHECALEKWREEGHEQGLRARDELRRGVEAALLSLGAGFVAHPDNNALREALRTGALRTDVWFAELLRLVYRLIFLITVEERGLLHPDGSDEVAVRRYADGYSLRRLRERAVRRNAHDRNHDLFDALQITFAGLATGQPRLALPALGGLFGEAQCPSLNGARIANHALLAAVFKLAWMRETTGLVRVNWRDMGPEELGSVYESLLELVPRVDLEARTFGFAQGDETKGNARKKAGAYYTPQSVVDHLLDRALEPAIAEAVARNPRRPDEAILGLKVLDPTCGSGHFLLGAAQRLAVHVSLHRYSQTPTAAQYRQSIREVVRRCIFGVDLNPMAVELCRVALWMLAVAPGLPLSFLDSHVQCGNSLLGATPELAKAGIPDEAWETGKGDDKHVARSLLRRNRIERERPAQSLLFDFRVGDSGQTEIAQRASSIESASEDALSDVAEKQRAFAEFHRSSAYTSEKAVLDTWCAAFFWPREAGQLSEQAPTHRVFSELRDKLATASETFARQVDDIAGANHFFHWSLAFPAVFAAGGFDVVLGNPPFLNQLERNTANSDAASRLLGVRFAGLVQGYADVSAVFTLLSIRLVRPGGRVALVQPQSFLVTRDVGSIRSSLARECALTALWIANEQVFAGAAVLTCAPVFQTHGPRRSNVARSERASMVDCGSLAVDMDALADLETWSHLFADATGIPEFEYAANGTVADIAIASADFADMFYALEGLVVDRPDLHANCGDSEHCPIVTTGLLDLAECHWGIERAKLHKQNWLAPCVDTVRAQRVPKVANWIVKRSVPKLLVASQTKVMEVYVDRGGRLLPSVPIVSVMPKSEADIWLVAAAIGSPMATAIALRRYAGSGMTSDTIKLGARQLEQLPLPSRIDAWRNAARELERAHAAPNRKTRVGLLHTFGHLMASAYGLDERSAATLHTWWSERLGIPAEGSNDH